MSAFDTYLQGILDQAGTEAHEDGSATIEAHHLLLAIVAASETAPARMLAQAGLDHRAIREMLDREFEHSLSAVGVSAAAFGPRRSSRAEGAPARLGASVKLALERGLGPVARKKDLRPPHLLLGILQAKVGTVPRALALAGVDRAGLVERIRRSLTAEASQ